MESANATAAEFAAAREPTGPAPVPLWRILAGGPPVDPLERWRAISRAHGAVARYRYGLFDSYLLSSAEAVKRVLVDNTANYTKEHPSYRMLARLFGNGLFTSEGSFWLRQRRLAQPAFHRQRLVAMAADMAAAARETADAWAARAAAGEPVSMLDEMSRLTLKVVGDALFGAGVAAHTGKVAAAWDVLNPQLAERFARRRLLPPVLPTRYDRDFRRARRALFDVVEAVIADKRARGGGDDLLSMFMAARDEETGARMTDGQLRDEVVTMLLAGHETTAVGLTWAWARLDRHPEVRARLDDELDGVLGGRAPEAADLPRLRYTRAVVDETLRLHPPAYIFNRHVRSDDVVDGYRVRAGGSIVLTPLLLHRNPAYWSEPDAFRPERWLDDAATAARPRFAYLPFSAGPRQCIGNNFSLMESTLVLATLAQRFAPRLVEGALPAPRYLVLARPSGDVPVVLEPRRPSMPKNGEPAPMRKPS